MAVTKVEGHLTIVVLGAFNPAIFQPSWMAAETLLGEEEAEKAEIEITHPEVSVFHTSWLRCEVLRERFTLRTEQESHYESLRDLAAGSFRLLSHTPIRAVGINHSEILRFDSQEQFREFGWKFVSPDPWASVLEDPGVARVDEQGVRPDDRDGYLRIRMEPFLDGSNRVLIELNDHIQLAEDNKSSATAALVELLLEDWSATAERARKVSTLMMERAR